MPGPRIAWTLDSGGVEFEFALAKNFYGQTARPTVGDDELDGASSGSHWYITSGAFDGEEWYCTDPSTGAAAWELSGPVSGATGAPDDAGYYVNAAHAGLSAEVVVPAYIQTLLDDTSAPAARVTLNVESATGAGDTNYTILATDRYVYTNAAFTAARSWTVPLASSVNPGQPIVVADLASTVGVGGLFRLVRSGADTINGSSATPFFNTAGMTAILWSDGVSAWQCNVTPRIFPTAVPTSSAGLAALIGDETGTGAVVFADTPTLVTPILGTPTSGTLTNCTGLPEAGVVGLVADLAAKEPTITAATSADYYRGDKTFQPLNKAAVGLGNVDNTSDVAKPVSTLQQAAIDAAVVGLWDPKGAIDCSANPNYPAALKGDTYNVSVAGKIGGASGTDVVVGDTLFCLVNSASGTQAAVGANWNIIPANFPNLTSVGNALITIPSPSAITFIRINADNSASALAAGAFLTALGGTTAGQNLFTLPNPGAVRFIQLNADNSVSALTAVAEHDAVSTKSSNIASATTTDLSTATGTLVHITGTTTITAFGTMTAGVERTLVFDGALTLTHNATSLILPGAANITTAAGDTAFFKSEGSGNWRCIGYTVAASVPFKTGLYGTMATQNANAVAITGGSVDALSSLSIVDTNASHSLALVCGSDLTANRTLTLTTGNANRTFTLNADTLISAFGATLVDDGTALDARNTLGLAINSDVQAHDSDLDALAALTGVGGAAFRTAANQWQLRTLTGTANQITVAAGDGISGAPTFSLPSKVSIGHTNSGTVLDLRDQDPSITLKNTGTGTQDWRIANGIAASNDGKLGLYDATAGASRLTIDTSGRVGIGPTTMTAQLHTNSTVRFANFGAGTATFDASGNVSSVSDERLKDIQGPFTVGLDALAKIQPILFRWNEKSGMEREHVYAGFSSQNVQVAIPEGVGQNPDGYLSLQDRALLAMVINSVKELRAEVLKLKDKPK